MNRVECFAKLQTIGYPELRPAIAEAIWRHEGEAFADAVTHYIAQGSGCGASAEYVRAVMAGATPATRAVVDRIFGEGVVPLEDLIEISKAEGRTFRTAVRAIHEQIGDGTAETDYLAHTISITAGYTLLPPGGRTRQSLPRPRADSVTAPPPVQQGAAEAPTTSFRSIHLYGRQTALCISDDTLRKTKQPTLRLEVAKAVSEGRYDWENKKVFQCTPGELALLYGVFAGFAEKAEFSGHGANNEKSLSLVRQENKYFISLRFGKNAVYGLPIQPVDSFIPMAMIFGRLKECCPGVGDDTITSMVQRICVATTECQ